MPEYGPFETEREVWATEACAAERAAWEANPVPGASEKFNMQLLTIACEELGIDLGAYDLSPLRQVAMYETSKCVALRGIIRRAFEAGKAAGPDGAVTEWGIRYPVGHPEERVRNLGEDGEEVARLLFRDYRRSYGDKAALVHREIGPWKEAPEGETG